MQPLLPQSCLFDLPDVYTQTGDGKRFLLLDETLIRRERVLMFASDQQLDVLFRSEIVYMDGTFSKTPPHFMQIYIIHAVMCDICKSLGGFLRRASSFFQVCHAYFVCS